MAQAADIAAILVASVNALVALGGGLLWRASQTARAFWIAVRVGQIAASLMAGLAIVLIVAGHDPRSGLLWLYMALPITVSIIAEQLRLASAQTVLDVNELEDAQAVGRLPAAEQELIVGAIVRRETAVVALGALVMAVLALRVLGTS